MMLFHWNIRENPSCECSAEKETIQHIVEEYPLTKFQQVFSELHIHTKDTLNCIFCSTLSEFENFLLCERILINLTLS
jgi:hypothetical protein